MKKVSSYFILIMLVLGITACKKQTTDKTNPDEENELITTIRLSMVDSITGDTFNYSWKQPGGPGTAITVDTIQLKPSKKYKVSVAILNESVTPAENITDEIHELADEHRFVYTSPVNWITTAIIDYDHHTPPIEVGLNFYLNTGNATPQTTTFRVNLRHYTSESPKTGGLANGSNDLDVTFPVKLN